MAFHVTGTPILAMAKRIAAKEKDVMDVFDKIYGIPPEKAATLTDPAPWSPISQQRSRKA